MRVLTSKLSRLQHLSDETISRLIAGEIGAFGGFRARFHLDKCWHCRSRREAFERAAMQVTEYRNRLVEAAPIDRQRRERLLSDLRHRAAQCMPESLWIRSISNFRIWIGKQMSPIVASAAIVIVAMVLLIVVWQRPASPVSAAQLLQRAIASDASVSQEKSAVIYQKVLVTTSRLKVEHEVYRDPRGIRHRIKEVKQEPLQNLLSKVGVDWEAPLSAASYSSWHDKQSSVTDGVRKGDGNLITLVSKVPGGWIQEETLTVRESDYHPVARTIETRAYGTIEIAELSYAVLPWSGVNEALFEPPLGIPGHEDIVLPPALPTAADLDVAELSVRLVLNQLHADEGEQISVTQNQHTIDVKGVVATSERKAEIVKKLLPLQHVRVDVLSVAELQSLPLSKSVAQSVQVQSVEVLPSPLAEYLDQQGKQDALAQASQSLLDASLKVRQNVGELVAVQNRFATKDLLNPEKSMMSQLSQSYLDRLLEGLDQEAATLHSLGFVDHGTSLPDPTDLDLGREVDRNDARCRELIAGSDKAARPASELVPEIYETIAKIRLAVAEQASGLK